MQNKVCTDKQSYRNVRKKSFIRDTDVH